MAYTTIDDPSAYFHTQLYSGNGGTQSITNDANAGDFKPDFSWIKERSSTSNHILMDTTRGTSSALFSSLTNAESSTGNFITSFDTDGFTLGNNGGLNQSSQTYVAWQWKANGGTTSSNTDGSITSTVQANTTAGFNIITYTGDGNAGATFGHGLGVVPNLIIVKRRDSGSRWNVWTPSLTNNQALYLDGNEATQSSTTFWNDTTPTSSVITLGTDRNVNSGTYVCYAFKNIEGYSKIGTYTGNGSSDGTFVYTGFRPAWVMAKCTSTTSSWVIYDVKRKTFNVMNNSLLANLSNAESTQTNAIMDILSNGFKLRGTASGWNSSGDTFIYMAFAEHPFVSSEGVPVTAR